MGWGEIQVNEGREKRGVLGDGQVVVLMPMLPLLLQVTLTADGAAAAAKGSWLPYRPTGQRVNPPGPPLSPCHRQHARPPQATSGPQLPAPTHMHLQDQGPHSPTWLQLPIFHLTQLLQLPSAGSMPTLPRQLKPSPRGITHMG